MNQKLLTDIAERAIKTFLQGFLGTFVLTGVTAADLDSAQRAALAGIAAVLSMLMSLVSSQVGSDNTAALLPRDKDTPLPGDGGLNDG